VPAVLTVETSADAKRAIRQYDDHRKLLSWLYLMELGAPALRGAVVSAWSTDTRAALLEFAARLECDSLLLRSDRSGETGAYPRGGYLVSVHQLETEVRWFLEQGRTVFLLEPVSPFDDLYSMSLRLSPEAADIEVVGPGFDASDLKRGDESPHEIIGLVRRGLVGQYQITQRWQISEDAYMASWQRRLRKVGRMLAGRDVELTDTRAEGLARRRLSECGETLLLDYPYKYEPIAEELLGLAVAAAAAVADELARRTGISEQVFSASYVGRARRLVFWDVVWPLLKYEGAVIPPPQASAAIPLEEATTEIRGLGASPGTYRGIARVTAGAHEFDRVQHGDVLVSPVTTPEVMRVLAKLGAIVTDRGGRLSHAAIVAREAGVPAVVGTEIATKAIRDGVLVVVDGTRGVVSILER
jgi:phosphohistidine swiveling domain-containing protein